MEKKIFFILIFSAFVYLQGQTVQKPIIIDSTKMALSVNDSLYSEDVVSMLEDPDIPSASHNFTPTQPYLISDDPIVEQLENMSRQKYLETFTFTTDLNILNVNNYAPDEIPVFSDDVIKKRLEDLNQLSPMELIFNSNVKSYIDLYANRKRNLVSKMLGLSEVYFPMFEETLDKYDVPLELKYLAIVESALNPVATSRAGARGLWQFMYATGKMYGLQVTSVTDDRYDPYKATDAACRHLRDLYKTYNSWELALAAYNCGSGNVNKAIRRAGGKTDYWQIWPYLPAETRGYVPAFIAVVYVMNYASDHNIYPVDPGIFAHDIDTVSVRDIVSFDQISEMLDIQRDLVGFLNPVYKTGIIPASPENIYSLTLPREYIGPFMNNEEALYAYKTQKGLERENLMEEIQTIESQQVATHKVLKGETLGSIAKKYRCTVTQLKDWNNLRTTTLKIGQRLTIYSQGGPRATATTSASSNTTTKHTVSKGETLSVIAQRYGCSVSNIQSWNNLSGTTISVGQVLQVKKPETISTASSSSTTTTQETYQVQQGDNLWSIAQKYPGISAEDIKYFNELSSNGLQVGQKLKIPKKM